MISEIRNKWIRKAIIIVVALPVVAIHILVAITEMCPSMFSDFRDAWRGPSSG